MKRLALMALASGMAMAAATPANAAIFASVIVDGTQLNLLGTGTALDLGTGLYTFTYLGGGGNVSINLDITGKGTSAFAAPDPQFLTQAVTVDATGGGSHTVSILLSQNGLTSTGPGFTVTNTINDLNGVLSGSATASAYVGGSNTPFDTSHLIGSTLTCGSNSSCNSGVMGSTIPHGTPFSETVAYNFTIASGRIQTNTQIGAVPEPATWGMMILGFGLAGGAVRMRRRKTTVAFA